MSLMLVMLSVSILIQRYRNVQTHTIDAIIRESQQTVAIHNTNFTSTEQFDLQNREQTHRRLSFNI